MTKETNGILPTNPKKQPALSQDALKRIYDNLTDCTQKMRRNDGAR